MLIIVFLLLGLSAVSAGVSLSVQLDGSSTHFPHNWEQSVGSGHMSLSLRSDYREQLTRCRRELGFKRVRMHGMMDDDMSTSLGPGANSYVNLDNTIDFLHGIGMDLLFEIGFMPSWLASNGIVKFNYKANTSPPKDYVLWATVMKDLAQHLLNRYGSEVISKWYFEVWNEPSINFWSGTPKQQSYFQLYKVTADAFRSVSPLFKLGGPVTNELNWLPEFMAFCNSTGTPYSFVSSHNYAGGGPGPIFDDAGISSRLKAAHKLVGGHVPFFITEWGGTYSHNEPLDEPSYAPFIINTAAANVHNAEVFSFWAFSDIFEEHGMPTGAFQDLPNFGLLNVFGVPKPSYRAFQLLHWTGEERLPVVQNGLADACNKTVTSVAVRNDTHLALLVTNTGPLPLPTTGWADNVTDCAVVIHLPITEALTTRIDASHANSKAAWRAMGSPPYPSRDQLAALEKASELVMEPIMLKGHLNVTVPARGVFALFAKVHSRNLVV